MNPLDEFASKMLARIILADGTRKILLPSQQEYQGIGLLERDDELPPRRPPVRFQPRIEHRSNTDQKNPFESVFSPCSIRG